MRVLKFGGSSVATPERVKAVADIILKARRQGPVVVVVSAFGGVTDTLVAAAEKARLGDESYRELVAALEERHRRALEELACAEETQGELGREQEAGLAELRELLHGVFLVRETSPRTLDRVLSFGERLSAPLVAAALRRTGAAARALDARELIVTDGEFGGARVDLDGTRQRLRERLPAAELASGALPIVTGFIAATPEGETTTLGRGGSDYTASLVGAGLDAEAVEIWTDVDGVMTADPRLVPEATTIDQLSYEELMELSHFGAKVIYPPSVHPTRSRAIPLLIRNTFRPAHPGTRIDGRPGGERRPAVISGVASIRQVTLLRLEGDGMVGVPGFAMRLFGALAHRGVNVILISQASSEHSICFAIAPGALAAARRAVEEEFRLERKVGLLDELVVEENLSVVAAVGAGMRERPGIAARIFRALGERGVNVRAIAQGSSELNISLVVAGPDEPRAVAAVHQAFFATRQRRAALYVAGAGRVGATLLRQLAARQRTLREQGHLHLELAVLASGHGLVVAEGAEGLDPLKALEALPEAPHPRALEELVRRAVEPAGTPRIFVDATASDAVAARYEQLLTAGVAVVTANKLRLADSLTSYRQLRQAGFGRLYYETTVGAGLPVIRTLSDLLLTGDRLRRLEGLLSGTLSFLADRLATGAAFSTAVREAYDRGYTEPDPREDLAGRDVARKLLILARLAGLEIEPEEVAVEPWLPEEWNRLSLEDFWRRLPELDEPFAERQQEATESGGRLAYLASLTNDEEETPTARVGLEIVGPEHPAATIRGTDNLIAFHTDRYDPNPLVLRGPGAGPEVTAAGVFADILRAVTEGD